MSVALNGAIAGAVFDSPAQRETATLSLLSVTVAPS
jgi:hypothetical protein